MKLDDKGWNGDNQILHQIFNFPYIPIFDKAEIDTYTNMNKFNYNLNE